MDRIKLSLSLTGCCHSENSVFLSMAGGICGQGIKVPQGSRYTDESLLKGHMLYLASQPSLLQVRFNPSSRNNSHRLLLPEVRGRTGLRYIHSSKFILSAEYGMPYRMGFLTHGPWLRSRSQHSLNGKSNNQAADKQLLPIIQSRATR